MAVTVKFLLLMFLSILLRPIGLLAHTYIILFDFIIFLLGVFLIKTNTEMRGEY